MKRSDCKPGVRVVGYEHSGPVKGTITVAVLDKISVRTDKRCTGMDYIFHPKQLRRLKPRAAKVPEGYVKPINWERLWQNVCSDNKIGGIYAARSSADTAIFHDRTAVIEWAPIARHPVGEEGK